MLLVVPAFQITSTKKNLAQFAEAEEYTKCIPAEVKTLQYPKCKGYETEPSDGKALVMELWGIWSTLSLPLLLGPLWPGVVVPVRVLSMGQIELFNNLLYLKPLKCMQTNKLWII